MDETEDQATKMDDVQKASSVRTSQIEETNIEAKEASTSAAGKKEDATSVKSTVDADSESMQSTNKSVGEAAGEELAGEAEAEATSTTTVATETDPVPVCVEAEGDANLTTLQVGKRPKRILHFSDGVLEEYSSDEDEEKDCATKAVDTHKMTWPKYLLYATMLVGSKSLKACDYVGEGLANFFGITTPKYQFEINEYEKMKKEEEEEKKKEDLEMGGWKQPETPQPNVLTSEQLSSGDASTTAVQPQRF